MSIGNKNEIKFSFIVAGIKTLVDGGIRVTLDLSEKNIAEVAMLMECKRQMIPLCAIIRAESNDIENELLKKIN